MDISGLQGFTPEEYLELEEGSEARHEYYDGKIIALPFGSAIHNYINANLLRLLKPYAEATGHIICSSDQRITTPANTAYLYPDASIMSGQVLTNEWDNGSATNPSVVIEIAANGTMEQDRWTKFYFYNRIPSLKEYIIIDADRYVVEVATRNNEKAWTFRNAEGEESVLHFQELKTDLKLKDLYLGAVGYAGK